MVRPLGLSSSTKTEVFRWNGNSSKSNAKPTVTCSYMLNDTTVALGRDNGEVRPVTHFLQVPEDVNSRIRKSVISIAEDHSIAVISIEEMSCIYLFGGYEHPLTAIQWRPPEDYIVLSHADGTAFVWQMQTGHLDRIVKGETAREIMADDRWGVCTISRDRSFASKQTFDCLTVPLLDSTYLPVLLVNLKYILSILAPARPTDQPEGISAAKSAPISGASDLKNARRQRIVSGHPRSSASKAKVFTAEQAPAPLSEKAQGCLNAAKAVLSLLVTESDAYSVSIRNLLSLSEPVNRIALGMKGTYGNISLQSPSSGDATGSWCVSSTLTASKLIAILSLVEIQEAAKVVLLTTIERMSKTDITALVKYWSAYLPASALPDTCSSQYMARSTIILGILGAENPDALSERVRKLVALSLTILLNDDSRISYKVASIDLLAQGFASWQPFIRADTLLKTLFAMAMDGQTSLNLVSRRARRAVAQIAVVNSALFVTTLTQEIMDCRRASERMGLLKLISVFTRKNPAVLHSGIPKLSEAIVKSLDPTIPNVRETILPVGTSVLLDLVQSFPQLDFHVGSQKLAVGTLEGAIIVYDLQTATRWQILEGHTKPVSAVSFSRDGKTIVSCSIKEGNVRLWHPNPGFFGMLMSGSSLWGGGGAGGSANKTPASSGHSALPSLSSQQSSRTFDFALQESIVTGSEEYMLNHIKFEWTGDRVVKLSVYDHIMSFNV
ncbi:hypothetical protein BGZ93_008599 [Podila epicladia]|nr:hypothetical protein BGZ93_008599 [Podila epicladia]